MFLPRRAPRRAKRNPALLVAIAVVVIVAFASLFGGRLLSIYPGFEGMQAGLNGYAPGNQPVSSLGVTLSPRLGSCSYNWQGSPTPGAASIQVVSPGGGIPGNCSVLPDYDTLVLDQQTNPVTYSPPYSQPIPVNYYVKNPNNSSEVMHVNGQVNIYTYSTDISIQSGSCGCWNFGGDSIWYNLRPNVWNLASSDSSGNPGYVYEAPLYAVVTDVQWVNQGTSAADATVVGHPFTFYSSASTTGQTLATLSNYKTPTTSLNSSLVNKYAPASNFPPNGLVYYPITLQSFSAQGLSCLIGCNYPSAHITVQLYTLQIGQYILTNPSTTGLGTRNQNCTGLSCALDSIGAFLNNPFGQLAIFTTLFLFLVVVIIVGVVVLTVLGYRIPLVGGMGRRRGGVARANSSIIAIAFFGVMVVILLLVTTQGLSIVPSSYPSSVGYAIDPGTVFAYVTVAVLIYFLVYQFIIKKRRRR